MYGEAAAPLYGTHRIFGLHGETHLAFKTQYLRPRSKLDIFVPNETRSKLLFG